MLPLRARSPTMRSFACALSLLALACGSEHDGDVEDEDASEESTRDGESERDGDGGEPLADASAAKMDAGAGDGARDDRLQPFEVGRRWSYVKKALDSARDAGCAGGRLESEVTGMVMRDGAAGYLYLPTCFDGSVEMYLSGDDIYAHVNGAANVTHYASSPVEPGHMWRGSGTPYVWQAQDPIDLPAGKFDRCIRRSVMTTSSFLVFCRGVGLVLSESPNENYRLELSSKNF